MCYTPLSARTAGGGGGTYFEDFPLRGVGARRVKVLVEVHGEKEGARGVAAGRTSTGDGNRRRS